MKYNETPNLSNIRIFGSLAYNKEPSSLITKLDSKAKPYYLIGFKGSNLYKLCNPTTNKVIYSRDCKIIEGYYYKPNNKDKIQEIFTKLEDNNTSNKSKEIVKPKQPISIEEDSKDELALTTIIVEEANSIISNTIELESNNKQDQKSLYNKAIITNILNTSSSIEPKTFKEVLLNKDKDLYLEAMYKEIVDLEKSNTQNLVIKPNNNTPIIKGRWVLTRKFNLDNTIKKYKARQVAKGFLQKYSINYKETFASTSKPSLIRLLLAIFCYLDWEIYTQDIKQAFPNAEIDTIILVQLPIGLEDFILNRALDTKEVKLDNKLKLAITNAIESKNYSNIVCKLNKALYGLKQASRQQQLHLTKILETIGFIALKIDNSIFIHKNKPIVLATHVDDILVFAKDLELVNSLYKDLTSSKLEVSNLGEIKEFLGVEIIRDRSKKSLIITQKSFITKILNKYNKANNKPKSLPLPIGVKLDKNLDESSNTIREKY